jgi:hypothetical protein
LAEAEERADLNEQAYAKCKARGRSTSMGPLVCINFYSRLFPFLPKKSQLVIMHETFDGNYLCS